MKKHPLHLIRGACLILLVLAGTGCSRVWRAEFAGTVLHPDFPAFAAERTYQLSSVNNGNLAGHPPCFIFFQFAKSPMGLLVIYRPAEAEQAAMTPTTDAIEGIYLLCNAAYFQAARPSGAGGFVERFLKLTPAQRAEIPGVERLWGTVTVQRFKNFDDLRIKVAAQSRDAKPRSVNGTFAIYDSPRLGRQGPELNR